VVDVITNSSTTIYTQARDGSIDTLKAIVNSLLEVAGSDLKADDLFTFEISSDDLEEIRYDLLGDNGLVVNDLNMELNWGDPDYAKYKDIVYNKITNVICQGLKGYFKRKLLIKIFEYGLKYIHINYKIEAVASEGMFGILLCYFNENIDTYHKYNEHEYILNNQPYDFIIKYYGGRGPCYSLTDFIIPKDSVCHPEYKYSFGYNNNTYNSLFECIQKNENDKINIVFQYFSLNYNALLVLTNKRSKSYILENDIYNLSSVYYGLHHMFFIFKHFEEIRYDTSKTLEKLCDFDKHYSLIK